MHVTARTLTLLIDITIFTISPEYSFFEMLMSKRNYGCRVDEDGNAVGMFGTGQDITEHKPTMIVLSKSELNLSC